MSEDDPKAENLIMKMWRGKFSTSCDGNIFGYSNIIGIVTNSSTPAADPNATFMEIVTNDFRLNTDVDYLFQHKYRKEDISFLFNKELIIGLIMLIYFMAFNLEYTSKFRGKLDYVEFTTNPITNISTGVFLNTNGLYSVMDQNIT